MAVNWRDILAKRGFSAFLSRKMEESGRCFLIVKARRRSSQQGNLFTQQQTMFEQPQTLPQTPQGQRVFVPPERLQAQMQKPIQTKPVSIGGLFEEQKHPRATKGTQGKYRGGEFVPKQEQAAPNLLEWAERKQEAQASKPVAPTPPAQPQAVKEKVYRDVGERIGGARKDIAAARKTFLEAPDEAHLEQLEAEDPDAAARQVKKANVWKKPEVSELQERGWSPAHTALALFAYSAIGSQPAGHDKNSRALYLRGVRHIQELVEGSTSFRELSERLMELHNNLQATRYVHLKVPIRNVEPPTSYQLEIHAQMSQLGRFADWMRGRAKMRGMGFFSANLNFGDWQSRIERGPGRAETLWNQVNRWFADTEKPASQGKPDKRPAEEKWKRPIPTEYQRKGGETIKVTRPEDYLNRFGLRGVEFGNWMDDDHSRAHVEYCAEAFQDMAEVLGLSAKDVSLNGRLALAFGARGTGRAMAHYEPGKVVINLTKMGGAGSLGHEWGHFLDHTMAKIHPAEQATQELSGSDYKQLQKSADPIQAAMGKIMGAILEGKSFRSYTPDKARGEKLRWGFDVDSYIAAAQGDGQKALEAIMRAYRVNPKTMVALADTLGAKTETSEFQLPSEGSQYLAASKKMGEYWSRPNELFARAFETYLLDKMKEQGRMNNYLVWLGKEPDKYKGPVYPYPQGEERAALKVGFDRLIDAIKRTGFLHKALRFVTTRRLLVVRRPP